MNQTNQPDMKTKQDIYDQVERNRMKMNTLDSPAERGSFEASLNLIRQRTKNGGPEELEEAVSNIVDLVPDSVLKRLQPTLQTVKWFIYDRTGNEIVTQRFSRSRG